jgi:hypothetical protein
MRKVPKAKVNYWRHKLLLNFMLVQLIRANTVIICIMAILS